jgi:type II secretion system protein N
MMRAVTQWHRNYGKYIWVGLIVFLIGLVLNFPIARMVPWMTQTIEKQTGYQIQMDEVDIVFPLAIDAKNVTVQGPGMLPLNNGRVIPIPETFTLDTLRLSPSWMSLLTYASKRSVGFGFVATQNAMKISGSVAHGPKYTDVSIQGKNIPYEAQINLGAASPMLQGQVLDIQSSMNVDFWVEAATPLIQKGDWTKAEGGLTVKSKNLFLETALTGPLTFDRTDIELKMDQGKITIDPLNALGEHLQLKSNGLISINKNAINSKIDKLDVRLTMDETLSQLKSMVEIGASTQQLQMQGDTLSFRISGPLNNPMRLKAINL